MTIFIPSNKLKDNSVLSLIRRQPSDSNRLDEMLDLNEITNWTLFLIGGESRMLQITQQTKDMSTFCNDWTNYFLIFFYADCTLHF